MTRATFGSLPSLFWESDQGRAIQAYGKDAVILSNYLRANRHSTMIGLYRVRLEQILYEQPVLESVHVIRTAFESLHRVLFAEYDEATAFVWVLEMARERLNLNPGEVLDPEDKRRKGAQSLYDLLPPSPFVEPFFEKYGKALRLRRRNFAQPDLGTIGFSITESVTPERTVTPESRGNFAPSDLGTIGFSIDDTAPPEGAYKPLTSPLQGVYKPLVSPFQGASVAVPYTVSTGS